MNRDRLERELTRFEEEVLSGLDKPPAPLPEQQFHLPALPPFPNAPGVSLQEQGQYQNMLPPQLARAPASGLIPNSPFQTFVDPSQHMLSAYTQPQPIQQVQQSYLLPQQVSVPSFCLPLPQVTIKPPPFTPNSVHASLASSSKPESSGKPEGASAPRAIPTPTVKRPHKLDKKQKKLLRSAAGQVWLDNSMEDWDAQDYRIFCGDLGNEVNDDTLYRAFSPYKSLQKVKVIRDKRSHKSKGYGFASFKDPKDFLAALKEVNGRYIGNRPVKLRKSVWKDRSLEMVRKKTIDKKKLGLR